MRCCAVKSWIASLLLVIMLVPAVGPLALARAGQPGAMHCMRMSLRSDASPAPAMHCHHAMGEARASQNALGDNAATSAPVSETSIHALDNCCANHDCCRGAVTSEWAHPATPHVSSLSLLVESAFAIRLDRAPSCLLSGPDSARAPPIA